MKRLLVCLTAVLALSGCGDATAQQEPLAQPAPSSSSTTAPPAPTPGAGAPGTKKTDPPTVPTRLRLGDINAKVVPIELDGSALTPPGDPSILGWWGKRAGARRGTTLLTGHTVHDGGGMFDDLEQTHVGARAKVSGHAYEVTTVEVISKRTMARRAPDLFAQTGQAKLVLVTCEDYNPATGEYASNVVVTLDPVE